MAGFGVRLLAVNDAVDWDQLKDFSDYPQPQPNPPVLPSVPLPLEITEKPKRDAPLYAPQIGLLDRLIKSRKAKRFDEAEERFMKDHSRWEKDAREKHESNQKSMAAYRQTINRLKEEHANAMKRWQENREKHVAEQDKTNLEIDLLRQRYQEGDPEAISNYCEMVLSWSKYPDFFPKTFELQYNANNKVLIVEYSFPTLHDLPTLKEVRYIPARNEFDEKHATEAQTNDLYDSLLYQITLRTIHELFEADVTNVLAAVVFNGLVTSIDPATGVESTKCVLSLQATKAEFEAINLASVDPKACFRKLRGTGSSQLHSMTPVAPILQMDREDKRFTDSYVVVDGLDSGTNLAAMDWEDFEHLIREVFEKEFAAGGGEVKVTRASRDGGVDAVVFDPDPIRGGKIVIQAKRYTNTVGVSAVRDLYGTLVNEGANKGILVSTADYGPDAYEFAKGKPITLLNGGNLLHLLEKHGHKACINLKEAKALLAEGQI